jgi:thiamine monophosphate kinase
MKSRSRSGPYRSPLFKAPKYESLKHLAEEQVVSELEDACAGEDDFELCLGLPAFCLEILSLDDITSFMALSLVFITMVESL